MPLSFRILTATMQHDEELKRLLEKCGMADKTCYLIEGEVTDGQSARILQSEDNAPFPGDTIEESAQNHIDALLNPPEITEPVTTAATVESHFLLNNTGATYHRWDCDDAKSGKKMTLEAIAESKPDAKPCTKCNPPALSVAGGEDGAE